MDRQRVETRHMDTTHTAPHPPARGSGPTPRPGPAPRPPGPHPPSGRARWIAYAAALWAVGFAAVNGYVQFGAVDADSPLRATWTAVTIANALVAVLKLAGAALAVATVQRWGDRLPGWLLTAGMWGAGGVLLFYGGPNLGLLLATGRLTAPLGLAGGELVVPGWTYAMFFIVPGVLFALAGRDYQRRSATSVRWAAAGLLGAPALLAALFLGLPALLHAAGLLPA